MDHLNNVNDNNQYFLVSYKYILKKKLYKKKVIDSIVLRVYKKEFIIDQLVNYLQYKNGPKEELTILSVANVTNNFIYKI